MYCFNYSQKLTKKSNPHRRRQRAIMQRCIRAGTKPDIEELIETKSFALSMRESVKVFASIAAILGVIGCSLYLGITTQG